jgi:hypothetical protein
MTTIRISDAEWELFAGEPAELLKLYCVLKRRMDFVTGIAGIETLISEVVLREGFTVDPLPGRRASKPITREMWRSAVRRLEKIGAIKTIGPLVFQFPYADRINPSKTATTKQQPQQQPKQQPIDSKPEPLYRVALSILDDLAPTQAKPEQNTSSNLLLFNPSSTSSCAEQTPVPPERFAMDEAWIPGPDSWPKVLDAYGLTSSDCTVARLMDFRSYWVAHVKKRQSQAQWEHQLAQALVCNIDHATARNSTHTSKKPHLRSVPSRAKSTNRNRAPCDAAQKAIDLAEDAVAAQCKSQGISVDRETLREQLRSRHKRGKKP